MYRKILAYFSHNKYRLMMFFLLSGATIVSVSVWRVRSEYSETVDYAFLIWNLFLAWIPFIIVHPYFETALGLCSHPDRGILLDDLLSQRTLHPDRLSASRNPLDGSACLV